LIAGLAAAMLDRMGDRDQFEEAISEHRNRGVR
jgi:hypothetical protein